MHISIANFSQMVIDRANIAIANKITSHTVLPLVYLHWPWPILKVRVKILHISTINIPQKASRQGKHYYYQHIESRIKPFHRHIYICHWLILNVSVKHILITNHLQVVKDRANIAIANKIKSHAALEYLHLTLAYSKGQDHVQFDCQYLANGDR